MQQEVPSDVPIAVKSQHLLIDRELAAKNYKFLYHK